MFTCLLIKMSLNSYGTTKNQKPSSMFGPKKAPSQSPYMRLLNRALSAKESDISGSQGKLFEGEFIYSFMSKLPTNIFSNFAEFVEGQAISREYKGEEGRYMKPKHTIVNKSIESEEGTEV